MDTVILQHSQLYGDSTTKDEFSRRLTAQAKANLCVVCKVVPIPWMIGADLAQGFLTQSQDHFAQPVFLQEGTALSLPQAEMGGLSVIVDAAAQDRAIVPLQSFKPFEGFLINIDFPANAATVVTAVGNTNKFFIIVGCNEFHLSTLQNFSVDIIKCREEICNAGKNLL